MEPQAVPFSKNVARGYCLQTLPSLPRVFFADDNDEK